MSFLIPYITLKFIYNYFIPIFLNYPHLFVRILLLQHIIYPLVQYHQGANQNSFIVWWHWCKWWRLRRQFNHLCWYKKCWCSMRLPFTFTSFSNMMLLFMRFLFYWVWWLHWQPKIFVLQRDRNLLDIKKTMDNEPLNHESTISIARLKICIGHLTCHPISSRMKAMLAEFKLPC